VRGFGGASCRGALLPQMKQSIYQSCLPRHAMRALCDAVEARCDRALRFLEAKAGEVVCSHPYPVRVRFSGVRDDLVCTSFGSRLALNTKVIFDSIKGGDMLGLCTVAMRLQVEILVAGRGDILTFMQIHYTCPSCKLVPAMLVGSPWVQLRSDDTERMWVMEENWRAQVPPTLYLVGFDGAFRDPVFSGTVNVKHAAPAEPITVDLSSEWAPSSKPDLITAMSGPKRIRCTASFFEWLGDEIPDSLTVTVGRDGYAVLKVGSRQFCSSYRVGYYFLPFLKLCEIELDVHPPDADSRYPVVFLTFDDGGSTRVVFSYRQTD
jgi:hypothetical protein